MPLTNAKINELIRQVLSDRGIECVPAQGGGMSVTMPDGETRHFGDFTDDWNAVMLAVKGLSFGQKRHMATVFKSVIGRMWATPCDANNVSMVAIADVFDAPPRDLALAFLRTVASEEVAKLEEGGS